MGTEAGGDTTTGESAAGFLTLRLLVASFGMLIFSSPIFGVGGGVNLPYIISRFRISSIFPSSSSPPSPRFRSFLLSVSSPSTEQNQVHASEICLDFASLCSSIVHTSSGSAVSNASRRLLVDGGCA